MNRKDKLLESTLLALQGKLTLKENKQIKKESINKKEENVDVSVQDDGSTVVDTEDTTVIVQDKQNVSEVIPEEEVIEVPVESDETIIPEEEIPEEIIEEEPIEECKKVENKEIKTEAAGELSGKLYDYFNEMGYMDGPQGEIINAFISWLSEDEIKRFAEIYEYPIFNEEDEDLDESKKIKTENAIRKDTIYIEEEDLTFEREANSATNLPYYYNEDKDKNAVIGTAEELIQDFLNDGDKEMLEPSLEEAGYTLEDFKKLKGKFVWVSDTTGYPGMMGNRIYKLDESKKCTCKDCKECKNIKTESETKEPIKKESKEITKYSSKTFNEAITKFLSSNYKLIESFKTTKVISTKTSLKIEGKVYNIDGIEKEMNLVLNKVQEGKSFTKYELTQSKGILKESKNTIKMMTFKNNKNILECKYLIKK